MSIHKLKAPFIQAILIFSILLIGGAAYAAGKIKIKAIGDYSQKIPTGSIVIVSKPSGTSLFIPPGGCMYSTTNRTFTKNTKSIGGMQCAQGTSLEKYTGVAFIVGFQTPGEQGQLCYRKYKIDSQGFSGSVYNFKYHSNRDLTILVWAHKRPQKYVNSYPFKYILKCVGL